MNKLLRKINKKIIEIQRKLKMDYVIGYPFSLTIEITNYCNLKCPFCPVGNGEYDKKKNIMSYDQFKGILDEIGRYAEEINLINWGEAFINQDIFKMIKYSNEKNINTVMSSNLNIFDEEMAEKLVRAKLDRLIVSCDGASQETYEKYRIGGNFNKVYESMKLIQKKKKELGTNKPKIFWQFLIHKFNEHEIEKARKMAEELEVNFLLRPLGIPKKKKEEWLPESEKGKKKYSNGMDSNEVTKQHLKFCRFPWEQFNVDPNGDVVICCNKYKFTLGNIFKSSFKEIWNNKEFRSARKFLAGKKIDIEVPCQTCNFNYF